jgi:methyl-accepting chemotaxis protein
MKIQTKILLMSFLLVLVVGVVGTIISEVISTDQLRTQINNQLETTARSRADHIQTFLEMGREKMKQLTHGCIILEELLVANPGDRDYNQKLKNAQNRLQAMLKASKHSASFLILDKNGKTIVSTVESDVGKDQSNNPYFLGGRQGVFIKDAYRSEATEMNCLAFSAPLIMRQDTVFLGVLVERFPIEALNRITADRVGLGETGKIYLVNQQGYMITPASSEEEDTFLKQKVDTENYRNCMTHDTEEHNGLEEQPHPPAVTLFNDYRGAEVLGAHAFIPEMKWALLAEIDSQEALAPVTRETRTMILILVILIAGGILLSIVISRNLTKPIVKLHYGVEEIERGNLDYTVGTKGKDEIGQLSRAFDEMTTILKKSRAKLVEYSRDLEKKVSERTWQLEEKSKESERQRMATLDLLQNVSQAKKELEKANEKLKEYSNRLAKANENLKAEITERERVQDELSVKMTQLEDFNRLAVGREMKMIELKAEINQLLLERGTEPKYEIAK